MALLPFGSFKEGAVALLVGTVLVLLVKVWRSVVPVYFSPLRRLRGPPNGELLFGNIKQLGSESAELNQEWIAQYGRSFRFYGPFRASIQHARYIPSSRAD